MRKTSWVGRKGPRRMSSSSMTMDLLCAEPLVLLSPHAQRIWGLYFVYNRWEDIQKLSEVAFGPSRLASFASLTDIALG